MLNNFRSWLIYHTGFIHSVNLTTELLFLFDPVEAFRFENVRHSVFNIFVPAIFNPLFIHSVNLTTEVGFVTLVPLDLLREYQSGLAGAKKTISGDTPASPTIDLFDYWLPLARIAARFHGDSCDFDHESPFFV